MVKAVAMMGNTCQKTNTNHKGTATNSGLPAEIAKDAARPMPKAPPSPPMANANDTIIRETNSSTPRVLRSELTKSRHRSQAMAVSWPDTWLVDVISCALCS